MSILMIGYINISSHVTLTIPTYYVSRWACFNMWSDCVAVQYFQKAPLHENILWEHLRHCTKTCIIGKLIHQKWRCRHQPDFYKHVAISEEQFCAKVTDWSKSNMQRSSAYTKNLKFSLHVSPSVTTVGINYIPAGRRKDTISSLCKLVRV